MAEEEIVGAIGVNFTGHWEGLSNALNGAVAAIQRLKEASKDFVISPTATASAEKLAEAVGTVDGEAKDAGASMRGISDVNFNTIITQLGSTAAGIERLIELNSMLLASMKNIANQPISSPRARASRGTVGSASSGVEAVAAEAVEEEKISSAAQDRIMATAFKNRSVDLEQYKGYLADRLEALEAELEAEDAALLESLEYQTVLLKAKQLEGLQAAGAGTGLNAARAQYVLGNLPLADYKAQVQAEMALTEEGTSNRIIAEHHLTGIRKEEAAEQLQTAKIIAAEEADLLEQQTAVAKLNYQAQKDAFAAAQAEELASAKLLTAELAAEEADRAALAELTYKSEATAFAEAERIRNRRPAVNGQGNAPSSGWSSLFAGGMILAPLVLSIKSGAEFEAALHKLQATAGDTTPFETLRTELLAVANQFDQLPVDVANAFYPIESAGFRGAEGLKVLSAAAAFARGTQTDLGISTSLVAKTLVAYNLTADEAARVTDILTRAVKNSLVPGKEFTPALASIKATGNAVGLTLEELATGLDLMTQQTKSAATGATYLKNFLMGIVNPAQATRKEAKEMGLDWLAAGKGMEEIHKVGLAGVLNEITTATHGSHEAQIQLFPDMRKNQAELILLADGGAKFDRVLKDNINSMGATHAANQVMDHDLQQAGKDISSLAGAAEDNLVHALTPVLIDLAHAVEGVLKWFNKLPPAVQATGAEMLTLVGVALSLVGIYKILAGGVMGLGATFGLLSTAATGAATAESEAAVAGTAALGPYGLAIAAVALAVVGIAAAWKGVRDAQQDAMNNEASYQQKLASIADNGGERGKLTANMAQIASQRSDIVDRIADIRANGLQVPTGGYAGPVQTASVLSQLQAQKSQLDKDYNTERARLAELVHAGTGGNASASGGSPWTKNANAAAEATTRTFGTLVDKCGDFVDALVTGSGVVSRFNVGVAKTDKSLQVGTNAQGEYPAGAIFHFEKGGKGTTGHYATSVMTTTGLVALEDLTTQTKNGRVAGIAEHRSLEPGSPLYERITAAFMPTAALAQAARSAGYSQGLNGVLPSRGNVGGAEGNFWQPPAPDKKKKEKSSALDFTTTDLTASQTYQDRLADLDAATVAWELHLISIHKTIDETGDHVALLGHKLAAATATINGVSAQIKKFPDIDKTMPHGSKATSEQNDAYTAQKTKLEDLRTTLRAAQKDALDFQTGLDSAFKEHEQRLKDLADKSAEAVRKILADHRAINQAIADETDKSNLLDKLTDEFEAKRADFMTHNPTSAQVAIFDTAGHTKIAAALDASNIEDRKQATIALTQAQDEQWSNAIQMITGWKDALQAGTITAQQYIVALKTLQTGDLTAKQSAEITQDIFEEQMRQFDKYKDAAKKTADDIAGYFGKAFDVATGKGNRSENLRKAGQDALKEFEKKSLVDAVQKYVMQIEMRGHKPPTAPTQLTPQQQANAWLGQFVTAVSPLITALNNLTSAVTGKGPTAVPTTTPGAAANGTVGVMSPAYYASGGKGTAGPEATLATGLTALTAIQGLQTAADAKQGSIPQSTADIQAIAAGASALGMHGSGDKAVVASVGMVQTAMSAVKDLATVTKSTLGGLSPVLGKAVPYVGLAMAAAQMFGVFGNGGPSKYAVDTNTQQEHLQNVFTDYSPTTKGSYVGSEGLRALLGTTTLAASGLHSTSAPPAIPANHTININTTISGDADPQQIHSHIISQTSIALANQLQIDNARRGIS